VAQVDLPLTAYCPDKRSFVVGETVAAHENAVAAARSAHTNARVNGARAVAQLLGVGLPATVTRLAGVSRALDALALAELDVPLAEMRLAALRATIHAEELEDAGKKDSPEWRQAATAADAVQKRLAVLEARRALLALKQAGQAKVAEAEKTLARVEAGAKRSPTTAYTRRPLKVYPRTSSGRRLALARWITDRQNPLAARVAMNHIWTRHFGRGIVPTVFDFGRNGQPPSHPALLDWLAVEFMERGWSMKQMHRLIVTSAAYRMASGSAEPQATIDPENRYLWRMNSHRMEAEVVRDSILHTAGRLDSTLGGPDIDQHLALTSRRRSLYLRHAAEKEAELLALFDAANVTECYQRTESIVPQQALALANSSLVETSARALARRLSEEVGTRPTAFVTVAFEEVLGRPPTAEERSTCEYFLASQANLLARKAADPHQRARTDLVHVLMNHNEFVTIR
jgi:hypothetical protein